MHVDCMAEVLGQVSSPELGWVDAILVPGFAERVKNLLICPIQRSDWYHQTLWGVETAIYITHILVADEAAPCCLKGAQWWHSLVKAVIDAVPHAGGLTLEQLYEILPIILDDYVCLYEADARYKCLTCKHWV